MGRIVINSPEAREKLTARLSWKLTSDSGYIDAGNVRDYADATTRSLVTRARSAQGARHVNDEQTDLNHEAYTFTLDERVPEQEKLIKLARDLDDQVQNSTEGATATIQNVAQGRWFDIGAYNINNVTVSGNVGGLLDEGTDYDLDLPNGRLYVKPSAGIANGETLVVTFDQPGFSLEKRETQYSPLFYCDLAIEEFNQYHRMWLRRKVFRGYVNCIEFPVQSGEFSSYKVKVTPAGPVTVLKRPDFQSVPDAPDDDGAARSSSSSRSSFSSSSSSSSSSTESSTSASSSSVASYTSSSSSGSRSSQSSNSSSSSTVASNTSSSSSGMSSLSSSSSSSYSTAQSLSSSSSSSSSSTSSGSDGIEPGNSDSSA